MTPRWQSWLALGGVLSIAAFLRLLWLDAGWVGADQARDLSWAARIAQEGDAPGFGPAMRNQLRLGVLGLLRLDEFQQIFKVGACLRKLAGLQLRLG